MKQEIKTKECCNCKNIKPVSEFYKDNHSPDKYTYTCKDCQKLKSHNWRLNNPDKAQIQIKTWRLKNHEKDCHRKRMWQLKNKERIKKTYRDWETNYRKNNPNYKLIKNLRRYHNLFLKGKRKMGHFVDLLGQSANDHSNYIKSMFYNNMTLDKQGKGHGKWQIHHICPLEFFDMDDPVEQKQAWHYSNTKPLWYEDHIEEHRKINKRMSQYENNGRPLKD